MKNILSFIIGVLPAIVFSQTISQQKVDNLTAFSRLYGYVRYFHPADEAAAIDWEKFLYYGAKTVETAKNSVDLEKKLNHLFNPIAPAVIISTRSGINVSAKSLSSSAGEEVGDIFWQHYGLGGNSNLYKSIRTNRPSLNNVKSAGFGTATRYIDATSHQGKHFRLRSMIKTDGSGGTGQMWVRVDRPGGKMGFFDNMDSRPVTKTEWGQHEITGTVDQDAQKFYFGVFLGGKGKVWADNFILEFEEQGQWKSYDLKNPSFESSVTKPEEWYTASPGYVFEVVDSEPAEGKYALLIRHQINEIVDTAIFQQKPAFGNYVKKELGGGVSAIIPLVLKGSSKHTYPIASQSALNSLTDKLKSSMPAEVNSSDQYVRLAGIMICWNIFRHFYPYHEEIATKWEEQLPAALSKAYKVKTGEQYLELLQQLTEKLKDGHISVRGPESPKWFTIPAAVAFAEGKIVMEEVDKQLEEQSPGLVKRGDIILKIDGRPGLEVLEQRRNRISGSQQWKTHNALNQLFFGEKSSELVLTIHREGHGEKEVRLKRGDRHLNEAPPIKNLGSDIYYINIGTAPMEEIKSAKAELLKAKGLVCDLRGYPRGNHELINYLMSVKDTNKWMFVPRITHPDYEHVTYEPMGWNMEPQEPHITAKVVFLTGGGAISYAESFMGFIKQYKLATIVGQPTAGANGNVNTFTLPGNYKIWFTGMKVRQQDGSQLHAKGIQPDVFVERTVKGITEGRDEYLEKALEILKSFGK